ncbi:gluzincin family metallopeptidase [Novosphingobium beihaiensis]|uniref:Uncharacterized protein n=1 Tax=Novosphingobium beihaiensis TaxID=2930389 RepID=A0ABT0BNU7_9SPHN|nr:hypothetical protein [Novosphingobium beihaiensis]MCJ2186511.1 hypothetical protein [Novosphingobium beihaiensis]
MIDTVPDKPSTRRLRVYAFDPAASVALDTAVVNDAVIELPWEARWEDPVGLGPANEYFEVIDYDQPCRAFYEPLDPNHPWLLAQDGLAPSEGNPQFHQQMVFAVAMNTVRNFEKALGRTVFWSLPEDDPRVAAKRRGGRTAASYPPFTRCLRIYPHALQEPNAYFSPGKGAVLFGYFKSTPRARGEEGQWVFTCLSQDIVAHETAHAILHGMRRRGIEPVNPDSLAFHEGFADTIALLQHFTMDNVVRHELGRAGGELRCESLLTGLASQLGQATGRNGALRMALETLRHEQASKEHGEAPQIRTLAMLREPHERGQCLVAAIFDTFVTIYERRTADLFQIAGFARGSPDLPEKLVARLAQEAIKTAHSVLQMCVRGLDYLPPAASTFGDYLRAMITADTDLVHEDPLNYRVALAESFRKREVPVLGCMSYAPDSLCWERPDLRQFEAMIGDEGGDDRCWGPDALFADALRNMTFIARLDGEGASGRSAAKPDVRLPDATEQDPISYPGRSTGSGNLRDEAMRVVMRNQRALHDWLLKPAPTTRQHRMWETLLGIRTLPLGPHCDAVLKANGGWSPLSVKAREISLEKWKAMERPPDWDDDGITLRDGKVLLPVFEVHSVRIARRISPDRRELSQMIAQVTQKRRGYFDPARQREVDRAGAPPDEEPDFWFRGGATIIVDLRDGRLERIVRQRIDQEQRLARQRDFLCKDSIARSMAMTGREELNSPAFGFEREPFAFMHGDMP